MRIVDDEKLTAYEWTEQQPSDSSLLTTEKSQDILEEMKFLWLCKLYRSFVWMLIHFAQIL